jgi:hypothetical protein
VKYNQPFNNPDPNAGFVNGNPSIGLQGSIPPAASIEYDQREIVEVIAKANQRAYIDFTGASCGVADNADLAQLRKAVEGYIRGYTGNNQWMIHVGTDISLTPNVIACNTTPAPTALTIGMQFNIKIGNTNTGPTVANFNGLGQLPVRRSDGSNLFPKNVVAGQEAIFVYNGVDFTSCSEAVDVIYNASMIHVGTDTSPNPNMIVCNTVPPVSAYATGMQFNIRIANTNTGSVTAAFNGLSALPVRRVNGNNLISGNISAGQEAVLAFNGSDFTACTDTMDIAPARSATLLNGPTDYTATLNPVTAAYTPLMTLTITPTVTNAKNPTLNIDGHGAVPILRNDGANLQAADLLANIPYIIAFLNGAFYLCGLATSQVPILLKSDVDAWVRVDGNDTTGDGSANTPDKAFRTINACWNAIGSRYAASPSFAINIKLGVPGTYEAATVSNFGGRVNIIGDRNNRSGYLIKSSDNGLNNWNCLGIFSIGEVDVTGVTFHFDAPTTASDSSAIICDASILGLFAVDFELTNDVSPGVFITGRFGSAITLSGSGETFNMRGNGHSLRSLIQVGAATFVGANIPNGAHLNVTDCHFVFYGAYYCATLGTINLQHMSVSSSGCTGPKYRCTTNSILDGNSQVAPGDTAGYADTGGQVSNIT